MSAETVGIGELGTIHSAAEPPSLYVVQALRAGTWATFGLSVTTTERIPVPGSLIGSRLERVTREKHFLGRLLRAPIETIVHGDVVPVVRSYWLNDVKELGVDPSPSYIKGLMEEAEQPGYVADDVIRIITESDKRLSRISPVEMPQPTVTSEVSVGQSRLQIVPAPE